MDGSSHLVFLAVAAFIVAIGTILGARSKEPHSRVGIAVAVFLPVASLGLFYSLAIRMHDHFGGWPHVIGMKDFPPGLVMHANLALGTFSSLILTGVFVWPAAALLCVTVPRMRRGLRYLGIFALACGVAFGAMQLAPAEFLHWWWD